MTVHTIAAIPKALVAAALLILASNTDATAQDDAILVVRVENVVPQGVVRLGLYNRALYPHDEAPSIAGADVTATAGETVITLQHVPVGTYAIEVYQDLNSNGKMDSTFLGLPKEPYGFSRDAHPRLSKPDFDRVRFDVVAGQNFQTLHLQNTVSIVASSQSSIEVRR